MEKTMEYTPRFVYKNVLDVLDDEVTLWGVDNVYFWDIFPNTDVASTEEVVNKHFRFIYLDDRIDICSQDDKTTHCKYFLKFLDKEEWNEVLISMPFDIDTMGEVQDYPIERMEVISFRSCKKNDCSL